MISNTDLLKLYELFQNSNSVCTDTRKLQDNDLFFALKGDNFNGNKYAKSALKAGASFAIIDEIEYEITGKTFLVENVVESLQALANHHRKQFDIPFIGITGSNGKTTTKELLFSVLNTTYKTHCTAGNFNNHIGVPLTLLSLKKDTEIAIIEMGANKPGDIEELCNIALPTHGIITNIGKAHLEGFGSLEGVARTKSALFLHLLKNEGTPIVNMENEIVSRMATRFKNPLGYSLSDKTAYCYGELLEVNPFIKFNYGSSENIQTQLIGKYNFENILAALAVGKLFNVEEADAVLSIKNYSSSNNRSQVIEKGTNKILLDAYNANPSSMSAAISNFKEINHPNKVVILGDMFELGNDSKEEHLNIREMATKQDFKSCYFIGEHFNDGHIAEANSFSQKSDFIAYLNNHAIRNSLILLKGSRGIGLEEIVDFL